MICIVLLLLFFLFFFLFFFITFLQTVVTLTEIQHMFHNLKTTLSADVHAICDNAVQVLKQIGDTDLIRPLSVESHVLNDPQVYQKRPRAGRKIVDDDMLYRPLNTMYKPRTWNILFIFLCKFLSVINKLIYEDLLYKILIFLSIDKVVQTRAYMVIN